MAEGLFEALMGRQLALTVESKVLDLPETSPPVLNMSCDVGPFPRSTEDPIQLFPCDLDINRELSLST